MDERDKRRVGEQIEPGGRPKAPGRLETLQRFVNTFNHDFPPAWDRLGSPTKARTWLLQKRLVSPPVRITHADVIRLRELREAIRALVMANHGGAVTPDALGTLRREGARVRLRIGLGPRGATELEPVGRGADAAAATVLDILHEAQITGGVAEAQGLPAVRVRLLRPLEEPLRRMVRDVDLRQPDEEPRLSTATGQSNASCVNPGRRGMTSAERRVRRYSHSIVPGGLLVMS